MFPQVHSFVGTLLAQAPDAASAMQVHSVFDFVVKGGPTMILIGVCSLVALTVVVERLVVLRRKRVIPPAFLEGITGAANDRARALDLCKASASPVANVIAAAVKRRGQRIDVIEKAVGEAGRREIIGLRHRMRLLGALPQVATMLGLLGTIFGMIKTFQSVAASGQSLGKTEALAKGIYEAWTCTAAGLLVAIPVMVAYQMLLGKIDSLVVEMDRVAVDFVENHGGDSHATELSERTHTLPASSVISEPQAPLAAQPAVA
ncbi:MAG TPA: MotA/TolQ/ExbB proton channel family protein [Phycisphaerae bacterium]|nr:MotA/TolQ/ExbB proton channel family protein [Phycisphaerae bacterium]